jgi:ABC-type cobalt transport system substrate-binding protein
MKSLTLPIDPNHALDAPKPILNRVQITEGHVNKRIRACVAATTCMVMPFALQGIGASQDASTLVETGVIFSAQQVERSDRAIQFFDGARPMWTPSSEEIARLESKLKPYLEEVANGKREAGGYASWRMPRQVKEILARLGGYKRQYFGFTFGGRRWIFVNGFCEGFWTRSDSWHDDIVIVLDGGSCFFQALYDPSSAEFDKLSINGEA